MVRVFTSFFLFVAACTLHKVAAEGLTIMTVDCTSWVPGTAISVVVPSGTQATIDGCWTANVNVTLFCSDGSAVLLTRWAASVGWVAVAGYPSSGNSGTWQLGNVEIEVDGCVIDAWGGPAVGVVLGLGSSWGGGSVSVNVWNVSMTISKSQLRSNGGWDTAGANILGFTLDPSASSVSGVIRNVAVETNASSLIASNGAGPAAVGGIAVDAIGTLSVDSCSLIIAAGEVSATAATLAAVGGVATNDITAQLAMSSYYLLVLSAVVEATSYGKSGVVAAVGGIGALSGAASLANSEAIVVDTTLTLSVGGAASTSGAFGGIAIVTSTGGVQLSDVEVGVQDSIVTVSATAAYDTAAAVSGVSISYASSGTVTSTSTTTWINASAIKLTVQAQNSPSNANAAGSLSGMAVGTTQQTLLVALSSAYVLGSTVDCSVTCVGSLYSNGVASLGGLATGYTASGSITFRNVMIWAALSSITGTVSGQSQSGFGSIGFALSGITTTWTGAVLQMADVTAYIDSCHIVVSMSVYSSASNGYSALTIGGLTAISVNADETMTATTTWIGYSTIALTNTAQAPQGDSVPGSNIGGMEPVAPWSPSVVQWTQATVQIGWSTITVECTSTGSYAFAGSGVAGLASSWASAQLSMSGMKFWFGSSSISVSGTCTGSSAGWCGTSIAGLALPLAITGTPSLQDVTTWVGDSSSLSTSSATIGNSNCYSASSVAAMAIYGGSSTVTYVLYLQSSHLSATASAFSGSDAVAGSVSSYYSNNAIVSACLGNDVSPASAWASCFGSATVNEPGACCWGSSTTVPPMTIPNFPGMPGVTWPVFPTLYIPPKTKTRSRSRSGSLSQLTVSWSRVITITRSISFTTSLGKKTQSKTLVGTQTATISRVSVTLSPSLSPKPSLSQGSTESHTLLRTPSLVASHSVTPSRSPSYSTSSTLSDNITSPSLTHSETGTADSETESVSPSHMLHPGDPCLAQTQCDTQICEAGYCCVANVTARCTACASMTGDCTACEAEYKVSVGVCVANYSAGHACDVSSSCSTGICKGGYCCVNDGCVGVNCTGAASPRCVSCSAGSGNCSACTNETRLTPSAKCLWRSGYPCTSVAQQCFSGRCDGGVCKDSTNTSTESPSSSLDTLTRTYTWAVTATQSVTPTLDSASQSFSVSPPTSSTTHGSTHTLTASPSRTVAPTPTGSVQGSPTHSISLPLINTTCTNAAVNLLALNVSCDGYCRDVTNITMILAALRDELLLLVDQVVPSCGNENASLLANHQVEWFPSGGSDDINCSGSASAHRIIYFKLTSPRALSPAMHALQLLGFNITGCPVMVSVMPAPQSSSTSSAALLIGLLFLTLLACCCACLLCAALWRRRRRDQPTPRFLRKIPGARRFFESHRNTMRFDARDADDESNDVSTRSVFRRFSRRVAHFLGADRNTVRFEATADDELIKIGRDTACALEQPLYQHEVPSPAHAAAEEPNVQLADGGGERDGDDRAATAVNPLNTAWAPLEDDLL